MDTFTLIEPFWTPLRKRVGIMVILMLMISVTGYYGFKRYRAYQLGKKRYLFPDFKQIPLGGEEHFWVGKIAETDKKAWLDPNDLTTHVLTAGSTGSGKSVSASIIVEEALMHRVPVIVFDPTSQWTGFLKPCKDQNLLRYYKDFGLDPITDPRPFKGLIYNVETPDVQIDFEKFMNPGEITVFNLTFLKPGDYDQAVMKIIDTMFSIRWEESPQLKMLVIFDEVHRLLEKYGGKGGYIALEKACREFRKWGIGLIMASQVNADFKEAVQGNILTEVQLNTKSLEDIHKVNEKYGQKYAERVTRQGIGVGMIQNPKYNNGKPWFIQFRPTLHSPHKIPEDELKLYTDYSASLDEFEAKIDKMARKGKDVEEVRLELKLARSKLKEGHFKMVEIYLKSLENSIH